MTDSSEEENVNKIAQSSSEQEKPADTVPEMTRTVGLAAVDAVLHYVELQPETMLTDMMLLNWWCDIAIQNWGSI